MKRIDLSKTVYDLTEEFPELIDLLVELGFLGLKNPIMRSTLGKMTTIPVGCKKQGKNLDEVIAALEGKGFEVIKSS